MSNNVTGYSRAQVAFHWIVVVLLVFQYLAHDGIVAMWESSLENRQPPQGSALLGYMHMGSGSLILILALARIYLRVTRGAPSPPSDEPWILQFVAEAVHMLIYAMILALPISGLTAWLLGWEVAGTLHIWFMNILLGAIVLHISGGLFQHVVRRSDVLIRMFRPQSR